MRDKLRHPSCCRPMICVRLHSFNFLSFLTFHLIVHYLHFPPGIRQIASGHATSQEAQRRATSLSFFLQMATDTYWHHWDLFQGLNGTRLSKVVRINRVCSSTLHKLIKNYSANNLILYKTDYKDVNRPCFTAKKKKKMQHTHTDMDGQFVYTNQLMSDSFVNIIV